METKDRYTYRTNKERLDNIKIQAIKEDTSVNYILDLLVDQYLTEIKEEY